MSDGNSLEDGARQDRRNRRLARVTEGELEAAVERSGGELAGLSVKFSGYEVLVTLRAVFPAGGVVCFVGGETLGACLLKAYGDAKTDRLRWREDRYAK